MYLERHVPESCRDAYRRDAWAALLTGIHSAFVIQFIGFIAVKEFDCNETMMGFISASPFVGALLTLFYTNYMQGRRVMPFLVWPHAIGRGVILLTLILHTPFSFTLIASISYILLTIAGPAYASIMREIYPDDKRGTVMSYIQTGAVFAAIVWTKLGGELLTRIGYRLTFLMGTIFGIAAAFTFGSIKTQSVNLGTHDETRQSTCAFLKDTLAILKTSPENKWFAVTSTIAGLGNLILLPLVPIFQVNELHMSASQLAWLTVAMNVTMAAANPFWGRYIDVHSPIRAWAITFALYALMFVNYFVSTEWWHMIPGMLVCGVAIGGLNIGGMNAILRLSKPGEESRCQALHSFIQGLRGIVGPFIGVQLLGMMRQHGIPSRYLFLAGTCLIVIGCMAQLVHCRDKGY